MSKPLTRPALPADAIGFIAARSDRPERLAMFRPDGSLSNTFSAADTLDTLRPFLAVAGMILESDGVVRRVA